MSAEKSKVAEKILDEYPGIVTKGDDPKKFICIPCKDKGNPYFTGRWYSFKEHAKSKLHLDAVGSEENDQSIEEKKEDNANQKLSLLPRDQIELNFLFTKFILEKGLPFSISEDLFQFFQGISLRFFSRSFSNESKISSYLVKKCSKSISETIKESLFDSMRKSPYSLSLDESSDIYGSTYLGITVKHFEGDSFKPSIKLLTILPITTSSNAQTIYSKIKNEVLTDPSLEKNFMGIASDEAATMVGQKNSVCQKLAQDYPYIINRKDLSHQFNLIYKKAVETFPSNVTDSINELSSHFTRSTQRQARLKEIQIENNLPQLVMLRIVPTRWLSMRNFLSRLLECWPGLKLYFSHIGSSENEYMTLEFEIYFKLLAILSGKIAYYNEFFQKELLNLSELNEKIEECLKTFGDLILRPEVSISDIMKIPNEKIKEIKITSGKYGELEKYLQDLKAFEKGFLELHDSLNTYLKRLINQEDRTKYIKAAYNFLLEAFCQMKVKLTSQEQIISDLDVVFLKEYSIEKWCRLRDKFNNVIQSDHEKDSFATEISILKSHFSKIQAKSMQAKSIYELWFDIKFELPTLYKIAKCVFAVPHGTVSIERIFSSLKFLKNSRRSMLSIESLESCVLCYQFFEKQDIPIIKDMKEKFIQAKDDLAEMKEKEEEIKIIKEEEEDLSNDFNLMDFKDSSDEEEKEWKGSYLYRSDSLKRYVEDSSQSGKKIKFN
jgi:hAT family C-terminal dimerisation region